MLIGRHKEKKLLKQLFNSAKAEFIAIYGRRRVGKTFLIKNFFQTEDCVFFYCSGLKDGNLSEQLEEFAKQIGLTFYGGAPIAARNRWKEAFDDLNSAFERIEPGKKIVLFFDELPWMATPRSGLLQALDYYWNRYWSHDKRIKLIVCGSSASWIINKIINNKGGLYNRVTRTISLAPFTLNEINQFVSSLKLKFSQKQILDLYMVLGGIPHYWALLQKGLSAVQNIDELFFQKDGTLVSEFERLFGSLFKNPDYYIDIIRAIASKPKGIRRTELIEAEHIPDSGRTHQRLQELQEAGFILEFIPYGHKEKGSYYKVVDEFTLFYLRWVEPNLKTIQRLSHGSDYWQSKSGSQSWASWSGLAFEAICYKHLPQIQAGLNIPSGADIGSWQFSAKAEETGAQIDLLFDRDDDTITICEIKYNRTPFVIDKTTAKNLTNKLEVFAKHTGTKKQLLLAMITAGGVKPNMYSDELVDGEVELDDLLK
ncbi:MAG: AAA family ATPase [Legionellales bacterium]|nr:AAA family ATPase [Legionellales bacterium]|tara:strand:+ start:15289 stop:16737 length:1449 start_codon:yes stop_codon:yes gene_type:complete